jgi:streptogramin lyase
MPVVGGQIAVGEGSVWISAPGLPLARIDPRTNQVAQIFTGVGGGLVFVAEGAIWIGADAKTIWRLDPKRIEATR